MFIAESESYFSGAEEEQSMFLDGTFSCHSSLAGEPASPKALLDVSRFTRATFNQSIESPELDPEQELERTVSKHERLLQTLFEAEGEHELLVKKTTELPDLELLTRKQIEEELFRVHQPQADAPAIRFLKIKKKKSPKTTEEVSKYRKKHLEKRFSTRFHKEAKILNKVRRTRLFWSKESQAIPNVFRIIADIAEEPEMIFEFQDFSRKEVLPDELDTIPESFVPETLF